MARLRKTAEELVPDETPLEQIAEAEDAPAGEDAPSKPKRARRKTEAKGAGKRPASDGKRSTRERQPIVRLAKLERPRGQRKERRGVVVSSAMDKTIVVRVDTVKPDPRYKKVVRRSRKFHAHDEENTANVGDVVRIVEGRPLSRTKTWRLAEVVERAR